MNIIVTAGHTGLGRATTRALSRAGAAVTIACRYPERAVAAVAGLEGVDVLPVDLLDPASVAAFTARYLESGRPLHVLVNNARATAVDHTADARGYEITFATSHLGHFELTHALHPALRGAHGARVVNVTSGSHRWGGINWDDVHFGGHYDVNLVEAQAKTANILFAVELDRRWAADGIRAFAPYPGICIGSALADMSKSHISMDALRVMGFVDDEGKAVIDPVHDKKTLAQGAATIVFAATSRSLDGIGGVYLKNCDVAPVDDTPFSPDDAFASTDVAPHALDPGSARRLWELSEALLAP